MFTYFSPSKSGRETDENVAKFKSQSNSEKRPRATSSVVKTQIPSSISLNRSENNSQKRAKPANLKVEFKTKVNDKTKTLHKTKSRTKNHPVRFISPHAMADSDEDDDEDVFNTPEAKRARAELEAGGEIVPAGAPISGDSIVNNPEVVDMSGENNIVINTEKINSKEKIGAGVDLVDMARDVMNCTTETKTKRAKVKTGKSLANVKKQYLVDDPCADLKNLKEPLDPAIQARVDTYKLKTEELTQRYTKLLQSTQESDTVMQDIYGAILDRNLRVTVKTEKAQEALLETWRKMQDHVLSSCGTGSVIVPSSVEFPHEVKCLIAKEIQGCTASLSVVTSELLKSLKKHLEGDGMNQCIIDDKRVDSGASVALEMEVKMLAQRTSHGVRPAKANVYEDTSVDALWVWEVGNLDKYFDDEAQKIIKRMRKNRKRLGQQLKSLARVVHLLHQKPVDEAKVSAEEAKVGKFGFVINAELQKAKDREMKEQDKRQAALEKKQQERERQHAKEAKEEEKRKREREDEEKKIAESSKRQKRFMAFFDAANSTGTSVSASSGQDTKRIADVDTSQSAVIARMDAEISFLRSESNAVSLVSSDKLDLPQPSIMSLLKNKASTKKVVNNAFLNGWSARRHRDSKRGVMKLLQFFENSRPAYYGTCSTRLAIFHGGRRPLAQYVNFDYAVDSDDEWEEEEPGESLSDDENDGEESDEDNLDYGDQWLAYEDEVDYMDGAEIEEDPIEGGDRTLSPTKHKLPSQLQRKRVKAKVAKPTKLEPQILGPFWISESNEISKNLVSGLKGELLCEPVFESTMMRKAREHEEECERLEIARIEQKRTKEEQQHQEEFKAREMKKKPDAMKEAGETAAKSPPQKAPTQNSTAKVLADSLTTVTTTPVSVISPLKMSGPQIDFFFKKVERSEFVARQQSQSADEQKLNQAEL
ncbi:putative chromatin assembly factor 1 subunit A [Plasmopara halstedii]